MQHYKLERVIGIEPTASAWKAEVLPLYDTRLLNKNREAPISAPLLLLRVWGRIDVSGSSEQSLTQVPLQASGGVPKLPQGQTPRF